MTLTECRQFHTMVVQTSVALVAVMSLGFVSDRDVARLEREAAHVKCECDRIEQGLVIADGSGVWRSGERPDDIAFNLPNGECIEMSGIPFGTFIMGTPEEDGHAYHDGVGHKVTLTEPFWMAKFPMTISQVKFLLPDPEGVRNFQSVDPKMKRDEFDPDWAEDLLTWNDACKITDEMNRLFGDSLPDGYRFALPTEAQWEYACRAGTSTAFNNGKSLELVGGVPGKTFPLCPNMDEIGWYSGNSGRERKRVGLKDPNAWNLFDMHGLTLEWCRDYYTDELERSSVNMINPRGPASGTGHVVRGGLSAGPADWAVSYWRNGQDVYPASKRFSKIGGMPMCAGMRLALVKDAPEAVDILDQKVYGKNHKTNYAWQTNQLDSVDRRFREVAGPINEKAKNLPLLKGVAVALEVLGPVLEIYISESFSQEGGSSLGNGAGRGGKSGDRVATGFGMIRGPASLYAGKSAIYTLHVGGHKIKSGVSWEQDGTSISVSDAGRYARVMAENPPVKHGHCFRTGVRATYGGKTYRKTIQIYK